MDELIIKNDLSLSHTQTQILEYYSTIKEESLAICDDMDRF